MSIDLELCIPPKYEAHVYVTGSHDDDVIVTRHPVLE